MRVHLSNTHAVEKHGLFGRALLTYTLAIGIELTEVELAAIDQKNLYARVLYEPPWHPLWGIPAGELIPALLVQHLVELHQSRTVAAIGYYPNDHQRLIGNGHIVQALEQLNEIMTVTTPEDVWFDI